MANNEYCQFIISLIPKYIIGKCTNTESTLVEEHCAGCPECGRKLTWAVNATKTRAVKEVLFLSRPKSKIKPRNMKNKDKKQEANTERDYVIAWKDRVLKARMREITSIYTREIMYSDVKNITELNLSGIGYKKIRDISALCSLPNLEYLNLESNQIGDISVLCSLPNLKYLDLSSNQISDISVLGSLRKLRDLDLSYNQISDIRALSGLINLNSLFLCCNQISDINALGSLTKLTDLNLNGNQISNISALHGLTKLIRLFLNGNQITDYSPIEHLKKGYGNK